MTYLVLARKWRPRSFETLVGQDHVVRALTHALDSQRLHHAWLFTGTRGVGKTTLSRILAKSLNCETGITSRPCGQCRACTEIDSGRFVDYLELDAASNRGVDEMTQLLEQAVYAPGAGRFKVYMIDEVHMLTGHAFNAMLKTLEEPPPHVKFILATTDPQKIPVTVLSRCLQFNLKQMPPDSIVGHLRAVLGQESMDFEIPALRLIAQAAGGSMRDALSLTDQAIAYSASNLTEDAVRAMLGTIDQRHLVRLLDALATGNAIEVLAVADELAMRGLSYSGALADLAVLLSRIAIEQRVTGVTADDDPLAQDIARLAQTMHPDAVQLFYSVAVHSRSELSLAPDEYAGFVMACLRMLALNAGSGPLTVQQAPARPKTDSSATSPAVSSAAIEAAAVKPVPTATRPEASAVAPTPVAMPAPAPEHAAEPTATLVAATSDADTQPAGASRSPADVAPWESLPPSTTQEAQPVSIDESGEPAHASPSTPSVAVGVERTPDVALVAIDNQPIAAHDDADAPPSWVDEEIPFEADSAPMQDSGFISDPDDDFETLASAPSSAPVSVTPVLKQAVASKRKKSFALADVSAGTWPALAAQLPVTGLAAELARQSEWIGVQGDAVMLRVAVRTLAESESRVRLQTVLCEHFGLGLRLEISVGATGDATAHAVAQTEKAARQQAAENSVATDPFVQALVADFGGQVISGTVRHLDTPSA